MSSKLIVGTLYKVNRDKDASGEANVLSVTMQTDEHELYTAHLSTAGEELTISKRQLSDVGLPTELMDAELDKFFCLANPLIDNAKIRALPGLAWDFSLVDVDCAA